MKQLLGSPKYLAFIAVPAALSALFIVGRGFAQSPDHRVRGRQEFEEEESAGKGGKCGVERWAVKTLSDFNADAVSLTPIDITVSDLARSPVGSPWRPGSGTNRTTPPDTRIMQGDYAENLTYRVRGTLLRYKLEGDNDYHLVIADRKTGETIIAESVDPTCPGATSSSFKNLFAKVRSQFTADFSAPTGQFTDAGAVPVTIVGVRFFDPPHGQNGVAQNGVELHPLLCISRETDCDK